MTLLHHVPSWRCVPQIQTQGVGGQIGLVSIPQHSLFRESQVLYLDWEWDRSYFILFHIAAHSMFDKEKKVKCWIAFYIYAHGIRKPDNRRREPLSPISQILLCTSLGKANMEYSWWLYPTQYSLQTSLIHHNSFLLKWQGHPSQYTDTNSSS